MVIPPLGEFEFTSEVSPAHAGHQGCTGGEDALCRDKTRSSQPLAWTLRTSAVITLSGSHRLSAVPPSFGAM